MRNDNMLGTVVVILVAIGLAIWWIEDRFGTSVTGYALMSAGGVIIVVIGIVLAMATMRFTMSSMTTFAQRDAQTDKYRMQAFREMSRGESAERAAAAKITVLDAKRIEDLSRERAKLLTDAEVARLQAEHERLIATQRKSSGLWDDEGDEDDEEGFTQW